ncbi:hypothetical protein OIE78_14810 [Streptomyces cellulosae]|uniref:Uncharacterized protein n=1 Tax=Streptomyces thermocarboxydus TaxID=59299 RepID=A0ABU3J421_9ACTN|nr:hypothetical protein [Streptomyces sp. McG7]MBT2906571.1 hypothetical protein [Streptomyces sp. McG8]MDT6969813.1 hypothetical protein [Streptomyces thermocarboxydus]MDX3418162.1 hypothetical protein [Streptomyces sp. MD20-1-1]MXQ59396.1 hypothetical protein [Streptomyces sp. XHT-2]THC48207.1 hypothetical protein E7X38_31955 [Streptomyces sp. Akac8]WSB92572.1 hypothetical protein OG805_19295 [Streptomyces cellulosae]
MFLSLPTAVWILVALAVTPLHVALMRWSMPTPKGKKSVSFIPVVLGPVLVLYALVKGYSLSVTLYLYASVLLIFVVMIVPVRKWVAADILRQEQNPDVKVKPHGPSTAWIMFSMIVSMAVVVGVWMSHT